MEPTVSLRSPLGPVENEKIDLAAGVSIELRIGTIGVVVEERLSAGQCVNDRVRCSYCFLKNALFPY